MIFAQDTHREHTHHTCKSQKFVAVLHFIRALQAYLAVQVLEGAGAPVVAALVDAGKVREVTYHGEVWVVCLAALAMERRPGRIPTRQR